MCGIVGYRGFRNASEIVVSGLKSLEYRGYDSWGIAIRENGKTIIRKNIGEISKADFSELPESKIAIGHTRWATHGGVTDFNAHPHSDSKNEITVVHNGIIENYSELRNELKLKNHVFKSDTDTEVIPHLIEEIMQTDKISLEDAVKKSLKLLEGSFALLVMYKNDLIAARKESPLVLGIGKNEFFIASDVTAFLPYTKEAIFIEDMELVTIKENSEPEFFNFEENKSVSKKSQIISWNSEEAQKAGFPHFMLKEIFEQPSALKNSFAERIKNSEVNFPELSASDFSGIKRIVIIACGTSYHAGLTAEYFFESLSKIPTEVEFASEFRYRHPLISDSDLVIAISQSGETADTLAALREAKKLGAKTLGIVNAVGTTIARECDNVLYTYAGPEIGVASTKAFTTQLSVLFMLSLYFAEKRNSISETEVSKLISEFQILPEKIKQTLSEKDSVIKVASEYYRKHSALYLGRGLNYPIALEGALKLKEISYLHSEGTSAAEMKHGPIALIDEEMPTVFIIPEDSYFKKNLSNIQEIKARKGQIIAVSSAEKIELADSLLKIPKTNDYLYPFLTVIPLQLLSYYIADMRGCSIDKPRNLAKSVTVE
ncbi:MAG: glutamine--fructose-6-phosphate transaminase (isomerizing) [Candidatus Diapherotrites archaeon]